MSPIRKSIAVIALVAVLILFFVMEYIDRPLAQWMHEQFHGHSLFPMLTQISDGVVQISSACLFLMLIPAVFGWRPGPTARAMIVAFSAVLIAVTIKEGLKVLFGRTWPETWVNGNPSFIHDHVYGFFLLHGGKGWMSFPSGHTTVIAAFSAASWKSFPRLRWVGVVMGVLVVVGLIGADFHWLSDCIAGAILGTFIGHGWAVLLTHQKTA